MKAWRWQEGSGAAQARILQVLILPVTLYGSKSWSLKKEVRKKSDFDLWPWRRFLRIPWITRQIQRKNNSTRVKGPSGSLWPGEQLGHLWTRFMKTQRLSLEKALLLGRKEGREEGG